MDSVRIDKWLWAARFFKTRSLAARACELGRVQLHGQRAKPARKLHAGDMLRVSNYSGDFEIEVLALSDVRGPASVAQSLYRETNESREMRLKAAAERKAMHEFEQLSAGHRPNATAGESSSSAAGTESSRSRRVERRTLRRRWTSQWTTPAQPTPRREPWRCCGHSSSE